MSKWQKVQNIADHYGVILQRWGSDEVVISSHHCDKTNVYIFFGEDATPENICHELAHYILLYLGISPWFLVPGWVREGWKQGTLPHEWQVVADAANGKDHALAMGKIYRDLCYLINEDGS